MEKLTVKILKLAADICWMHGNEAGNRTCQDWSGGMDVLDTLTPEEKDKLYLQYEEHNSGGKDFESGGFPEDEMVISFMIARALELIVENKDGKL